MVVRGQVVFEYRVQVESQYMAEETALICRLQKKIGMLVRGRLSRDRLRGIELPLVHISSQNSYESSTYLRVLQRLSLPQDSEIHDFIFGLLNRRRQGKKWQVIDGCQGLRHEDLSSPPCPDPVSSVPFQNTFISWTTDVSWECILLVRSHQPASFCDHVAERQRKISREGEKQLQNWELPPPHTTLSRISENPFCISWRSVVTTQLPKWSVFSPAEGVQKR